LKTFVIILFLGIFSIGFATVYAQFPGTFEAYKYKATNVPYVCGDRQSEEMNCQAEMAPLMQYKQGISLENISCKRGLELVVKNSDNMPACLTSSSAKILVDRGWAVIIESKQAPVDPQIAEIMRELGAKPLVIASEHFEMGNYTPNISLTLSEFYGQDVIDFKGAGFRSFHVIKITITNDEGFYVKLKTKTAQFSGELDMPWIIPESLKSGEYNVLISDKIDSHQLTIHVQR